MTETSHNDTPVESSPSLPDAGRGPALLGVLLIVVAMWMAVPQRLALPGHELNLGFTMNNAIFLVENSAMWATLLLAAGAAALRSKRLLLAAVIVVGVHLLFQVGTMVVQLALGATPDLILGTGFAILSLVTVVAGLLVALLVRSPRSARLVGLIIVLVGALVHALLSNVLLPMISLLSYGGVPPGLVGSLVLSTAQSVLLLAVVALVGWAAPVARRVGAVLAVLVAALGVVSAVQAFGNFGPVYSVFQILPPVLVFVAVAPAVLAARRLAGERPA